MSRIDQLREQIDACRTGGDDLHLPDLAELARAVGEDGAPADPTFMREFDRSQRFDRTVVSALQDVAVPAGMLERLLAKTTAAASDRLPAEILGPAVGAAVDPSTGAPAGETIAVTATTAKQSRRWVLASAIGAGLVAAGIVAVVVVLWHNRSQNIELDQLADDAQSWNGEAKSRTDWRVNPPDDVLKKFSVDSVLLRGDRAIARWRTFRTARGETVVAYDVSSGRGDRAILFVVSTPHRYIGIPSAPPLTALPGTTGGLAVGAWQNSAGLLYVLVVEGGGGRLNDYLRVTRPA